ncbi:MAG TPA: membrane protein insertase YidC [Capsulimonadaceae bacterium]|nr:membrane protein insertase YidC [Capsulimonadaceae bacterium]
MIPHFALSVAEIVALFGMIAFFFCCCPRPAFAAGGPSVAPAPAPAYHRVPAAMALDRINSRQPLYKLMDFLVKATGHHRYSYPFSLFLLSLLVRLGLLPWTVRQYRDSLKMQGLQSEIQRLQEKHKKSPELLAKEVSALYHQEGINYWPGIVFGIVQAAIFLGLYHMVALYQYQFTHGSFLWIGSALAHSFPRWIGGNLAQPDLLLLCLYGLSMCFAPWLTAPTASDRLGIIKANTLFTALVFGAWAWIHHTPSAFVLYWLISNCLTLSAQVLMKRLVKIA